MNTTPTFHAVDDRAISPVERLEFFVHLFAFPLTMTRLSNGGREAHFSLSSRQDSEVYLKRAQRIISCLHLPFEATLKIHEMNGIVLGRKLIIKFTGK